MIVGGALVKRAGIDPGRPIVVVAAAGEEVGGYGARHLVTWLRPGLAIIGEPSANQLRRGHRGKFEIVVRFYGRSAHASAGPELTPTMPGAFAALRELPLRATPSMAEPAWRPRSFMSTRPPAT